MSFTPPLNPLPSPNPTTVTPEQVEVGSPIPPIKRIRLFSADDWEDFTLEWAHSLNSRYSKVLRCGGAGDMGRDIVAFVKGGKEWHNYQCKHYAKALAPSNIYVEIGKLLHYSFLGHYEYPQMYFFVAPRGAGTKLDKLLKSPTDLKRELFDNWDSACYEKITKTAQIPLTGKFLKYAEAADFSIFDTVSPITMIEEHRATQFYVARFGGGLPPRPVAQTPPAAVASNEVRYVDELFGAYTDDAGTKINDLSTLRRHTTYSQHFDRSRQAFYSAESLRNFSRDNLPVESYSELQDDIFEGVIDVVNDSHCSAYKRCIAVTQASKQLQISHPLQSRMKQIDRSGVCHQLVDEGKITWVK